MKVLVLGAGAREHALCRSLAADPDVTGLACAPGNAGIAAVAGTVPVDLTDSAAVADLVVRWGAELVVVGPEGPLVAGVADEIRSRGVDCFGPSRQAARLEGSKAFAKEVMAAAGVPTALAHVCDTAEEVAAALDAFGPPFVVKDDALAAGKGVLVTTDRQAALAHAASCGRVVVEEYLDGPEVSLLCVSDGTQVVPLAAAQDFKRLGDGDTGPNTGGMGAYSPLPWADPFLADDVVERVVRPTVDELARRGTPFVGIVYAGLALTPKGMRVVEFNARFGDPETQVVLARLLTPLAHLLRAAATGRLDQVEPLRWSPDAAVTVVVAAAGYPGAPVTGDPVSGIAQADAEPGCYVLHAGTRDADGTVVSAGGRVLSIVGTGPDLATARDHAYRAAAHITLPGRQMRTDIAAAAVADEIVVP